ncbi:MAG: ISKra4 family transposase [Sorangiineae bacterium]|nr:ISKra4 family transposase [Polyangiaceae bacterium]MEB2322906.1 ISKra4 family transposase [Sorangiineae bacterium]
MLGAHTISKLTPERGAATGVSGPRQHAAARDPKDDFLIISTDGKGIVMRHEDLREGTRRAAEKSGRKLETRLTPGERGNRKRMAQVATVYSIAPFPRGLADIPLSLRDAEEVDAKRPRPTDKRVWASVEKTARRVIRDAFEEALRRDPKRARRWVVLVDGEPKQLRAVKAEARRACVKVTILADIVHVLEYIWAAARALFGGSNPKAKKWVGDRPLALLIGRSGGDVAQTMRWWGARDKKLDAAGHAAIDKACAYLADRTRTRLLRHQDALRDGLPIAAGVIEGACRYVVKDRMDRTGSRWSLTGAEAVLRLRALRASKDFDDYWRFHLEREKDRNHASRYEDAKIPEQLPAPKPRLRRVK